MVVELMLSPKDKSTMQSMGNESLMVALMVFPSRYFSQRGNSFIFCVKFIASLPLLVRMAQKLLTLVMLPPDPLSWYIHPSG